MMLSTRAANAAFEAAARNPGYAWGRVRAGRPTVH
jgi:hypothetical protein